MIILIVTLLLSAVSSKSFLSFRSYILLIFDSGDLYAVLARSVRRYSPSGAKSVAASSGLGNAIGIAFDSDGTFYVTDQGLL